MAAERGAEGRVRREQHARRISRPQWFEEDRILKYIHAAWTTCVLMSLAMNKGVAGRPAHCLDDADEDPVGNLRSRFAIEMTPDDVEIVARKRGADDATSGHEKDAT